MRSVVEVATLQLEETEGKKMLGESLRLAVTATKSLNRRKDNRICAIEHVNKLYGQYLMLDQAVHAVTTVFWEKNCYLQFVLQSVLLLRAFC